MEQTKNVTDNTYTDISLDQVLDRELKRELTHGMLVSNVAYLVARELNLSEEECNKISLAGMMHDVGKLQSSSYLATAQNRSMEIDQMRYTRTHPTLGYATLKEKGFDPDICNAILYHHENYDGTGYPANLVGENIPFFARILRVCDVFSALISERPYREAFDIDTAIELMIDEVRHFDMRVFLAFQRVVQSNELIFAIGELSLFTIDEFHYEFNKSDHPEQAEQSEASATDPDWNYDDED